MEVRVLFWAPSFPLSKLFDQLKDAARSREEKSPGLLAEALRKRQASAAAPEGRAPIDEALAPRPAEAHRDPPPTRISSYSGVGLAVLIFAIAVLAWHNVPFRAPVQRMKIDPAELKLDRSLDTERITPKGTSPTGRPS